MGEDLRENIITLSAGDDKKDSETMEKATAKETEDEFNQRTPNTPPPCNTQLTAIADSLKDKMEILNKRLSSLTSAMQHPRSTGYPLTFHHHEIMKIIMALTCTKDRKPSVEFRITRKLVPSATVPLRMELPSTSADDVFQKRGLESLASTKLASVLVLAGLRDCDLC